LNGIAGGFVFPFYSTVAGVSGKYKSGKGHGCKMKEVRGQKNASRTKKRRIMQKLAFISFAGIVAILLVFTLQEPGGKKVSGKQEGIAAAYMHAKSPDGSVQPGGHKN
jgi:hypothetical protein